MNKVFGIGLSRTGTTSLTTALQVLGYRAVHFPSDEQTQTEFYRFFESDAELINLTVLKYFDAITDTPVCTVFKALDRSYPGSKFILTIRDEESWLASCHRYWEEYLIPHIALTEPSCYNKFIRYINNRLYGTEEFDRDRFLTAYTAYHAEVLNHFKGRDDSLAILNICTGEGWDTLAPFLGTDEPNVPFPFENRLPAD